MSPLMIFPLSPSFVSWLLIIHETSDGPVILVSMDFGIVVCYIGTLFGRVHGDLYYIFYLNKFLFFILPSILSVNLCVCLNICMEVSQDIIHKNVTIPLELSWFLLKSYLIWDLQLKLRPFTNRFIFCVVIVLYWKS